MSRVDGVYSIPVLLAIISRALKKITLRGPTKI